jgi:hypothetical protein
MRESGHWPMRLITGCLVVLMLFPFEAGAAPWQQETNSTAQGAGAASQAPLPDSPGSVRSQTVAANPQSNGAQPYSKEQGQEPVGTAAAKSVETTGVAGSNPAGAAIAPAKQRRTRAVLIKVGAIVGAGVAVGTVMALSSGSPSRPPGSR